MLARVLISAEKPLRLLTLGLGVIVVAAPHAGNADNPRPGTIWHTARLATHAPCVGPHRGPLVYHYPVRPFRRQHPIRGSFGDPRTLVGEAAFGTDKPRSPGSYSFHNGIDVTATTGTAVYPVASGVARLGYGDEVIVDTTDDRHFQYFHLHPTVRAGEHVIAYRTVLGRVLPHWLHIHLAEIDGFRIHNPLDPGHLEPYSDRTIPVIDTLEISDVHGGRLDSPQLHGRVLLSAQAQDLPALPVPGVWLGLPVTPARVSWQLQSVEGTVILQSRVVVDFRHSEPPRRDFWRVYAAGTYQNFPVFDGRYFFGRAGRYVFNLTDGPFDTTRFPNGDYDIVVKASDVCGNTGSLRERIQIKN
jgi:hypothetical protein